MKRLINFGKIIGLFLAFLILIVLFSSILNYITNLSGNALNLLNIVLISIAIFILSYKEGKITTSKGYLCGIKIGTMLCSILLIISVLLFIKNIKFSTFIYYAILILIAVFGSIIGINKKKD